MSHLGTTPKNIFITCLATKNYLNGLLCLKLSLDNYNVKYPLYCLVFKDILDNEIEVKCKKLNIHLILVDRLTYNNERLINSLSNDNKYVLNSSIKGKLFSLYHEHFEKIIYLDCDMVATANIDCLFDYPIGSALYIYGNPQLIHEAHSSLFIYKPMEQLDRIFQFLIQNYDGLDGNIIGSLYYMNMWNKTFRIPNDIYGVVVNQQSHISNEKIKLIHNCETTKYWMKSTEQLAEFIKNNSICKNIPIYLQKIKAIN